MEQSAREARTGLRRAGRGRPGSRSARRLTTFPGWLASRLWRGQTWKQAWAYWVQLTRSHGRLSLKQEGMRFRKASRRTGRACEEGWTG